MTLRLRRKRQTTALTSKATNRHPVDPHPVETPVIKQPVVERAAGQTHRPANRLATPIRAALLSAVLLGSPLNADSPYNDPTLRPAPKLSSSLPATPQKSNGQAWRLRWSKPGIAPEPTQPHVTPSRSTQRADERRVAKPTPPVQRHEYASETRSIGEAVRRHGIRGAAASTIEIRTASLVRPGAAAPQVPRRHGIAAPGPTIGSDNEPGLRRVSRSDSAIRLVDAQFEMPQNEGGETRIAPPDSGQAPENPFEQQLGPTGEANPLRSDGAAASGDLFAPPEKPTTAPPTATTEQNSLFDAPTGETAPRPSQDLAPMSEPGAGEDASPSLRDLLDEEPATMPQTESPSDRDSIELLPPPATQERPLQSPFSDPNEAPQSNEPNPTPPQDNPFGEQFDDLRELAERGSIETNCDDFRAAILRRTIDQISLDPSPPFRPDEINQVRYEKLKQKFDADQAVRQWRTIDGEVAATGALRDLAYGSAVLENDGSKLTVPLDRLSEGDLAYISDTWGLPAECLLPTEEVKPRNWAAMTMTWKASNLCHKPVYFADTNLERYGHTHGPWQEPLVQTAHFFGNVLILPYKMGIHPPEECQYTLGYYRPGSCAPWIVPPVPISARGALSQAAVMTGGAFLIP